MTPLTLTLEPIIYLSRQQFYQLCQTNPDLKLKRTAQGDRIVMPPPEEHPANAHRQSPTGRYIAQ